MKLAIAFLALLAGAVVFICLFTESVPPEALTRTRMTITEYRIRDYAAQNHRLPAQLSDLPPLSPDRDGNTDDAWGRPLVYMPQPDSSVILSSHGKDGSSNAITVRFTIPGVNLSGPTTVTTKESNDGGK